MLTDKQLTPFDATTKENVSNWLKGNYDAETKEQIVKLVKENPQEITNSFYTKMAFGTGGMRGIMGVGTNRINQYTVRAATQGLANYIAKQEPKPSGHAVFISHDSRNRSRYFAEETAKVLAANGIKAYITRELRPTPLVSYGCRHYHCTAAVMITASHNPPEYNGYKVYWSDGGQVTTPHDSGIIDEVNAIADASTVKTTDFDHPLIQLVGHEIDEAYYDTIKELQHYPQDNHKHGKELHVVFTPLHGTGITMVPHALKQWGFTTLIHVDSQKEPDGNFPTTNTPNPEERAALQEGIDTMNEHKADILLATDPDADRVGIAVRHDDDVVLLNGNEIACLCLEHICQALTKQNRMPENSAFIKTIVTTELFQAIAAAYDKPCFNVLTGFKHIAKVMLEWEQNGGYQYLFGGEESYGYLLGTHARDKDAVISCALICEVALQAKRQGLTLVNKLHELYGKYGVYREKLLSVAFEDSKAGKEQMEKAMATLRQTPPTTINKIEVITQEDYQTSTSLELATKDTTPITLPKSNVLLFWLADGSKVVVRPSGTEPKIKLYCGVKQEVAGTVDDTIASCDKRANGYLDTMKKQLLG